MNKLKTVFLCLTLHFVQVSGVFAQSGIKDSVIRFTFLGLNYGFYAPGGDLADRFGNCSMAGMDLLHKTSHNLVFGLSGGFIFGNNIKEPGLMSAITTSGGEIIGADGLIADVRVFERGYQLSGAIGKIFPVSKLNPNSGILLMGGPGFLQHKIRIETIGNTVPMLNKEYRKGYDRLTNGLELREFIGFVSFGNRQLVNFYAGIECIQAFTGNRRSYNFDNAALNGEKRTDLLFGLKVGWIMPFYKKKPKEYYLY
ncbi:MAG TPA: hypothetical protein VFW78_13260 [Bacteroidia bacterium]|nr:hypothetical protein [Bacteroidia bacterium]